MEYHYADAVKLAGHSCPTVAGSYLMVIKGLQALYGTEMPERGNIEVLMSKDRDAGTTGVIASIATLLTGAATEMGFAGVGIAKCFMRRNLLTFDNTQVEGTLALRRKDNGKTVVLTLNLDEVVPWTEEMKALMPKAFNGTAKAEEMVDFGEKWQERVRKILIDFANDERLILVQAV